MNTTAVQYFHLKTRCTITPTFRYVQPYIRGRTVDIGTGTGEYLEKFPAGSVGLDVSEENIRIVEKKGLEVINADINESLPFVDATFDTVFCSHVIEHVDSPLELLREAERVLRPDGTLVLGVPIEKTLVRLVKDNYFKDHKTHLYGLSVECVARLLEQAGLKQTARYYNFPILNRFPVIDRILQKISGSYCQYFCTMYWIVAKKKIREGSN